MLDLSCPETRHTFVFDAFNPFLIGSTHFFLLERSRQKQTNLLKVKIEHVLMDFMFTGINAESSQSVLQLWISKHV